MTGLFASKKYDSITYPIDAFFDDAEEGKLANVVFVDPDYTTHSELTGTSNDYHPYGSVQAAEEFVAQVHDALGEQPAVGPHGLRAELRRERRVLRPRRRRRRARTTR